MFDHISLEVSDIEKSRKFWSTVLLGFGFTIEHEDEDFAMFSSPEGNAFVISAAEKPEDVSNNIHLALPAKDRAEVEMFYKLAVDGGGKSNLAPALHPEYHEGYYAAFVYDPDGHNIEAVFHGE